MKKVLCVLSMALLFVSGGVFANGTSEATSEKTDQGPITVKYAFWGNPDAIGVENEIIDEFEKTHPNIQIEPIVSAYEDYHEKLMTMIAGNMAPDVMRIDSYNFADFMTRGACQNLDQYIEKTNFDMNIYPVAAINEATVDGSVYALPWATAPLYTFLNINAFEKAGIDLPPLDWTVDDFVKICHEFKESGTDCYGYSSAVFIEFFLPFIWANGGNLLSADKKTFTLDSDEACKGIQTIADLYQDGCIPKDTVSISEDTITRWFTNGSIAMRFGSLVDVISTQKVEGSKFEVWTMPSGIVKNTTVYKSNEICLSKDSQVKDAAWEFMKFLRGNEGERLYVKAKRISPSLLNDDTLWPLYLGGNDGYPKQIKNVTGQIATTYGHGLSLVKGYSELRDSLTPIFQKIMMGDMTAKEAMAQNKAKFQNIIDRNNK